MQLPMAVDVSCFAQHPGHLVSESCACDSGPPPSDLHAVKRSVRGKKKKIHDLHNTYPPLGAMGAKKKMKIIKGLADKHIHFAGTSSAEAFQLYIYIA